MDENQHNFYNGSTYAPKRISLSAIFRDVLGWLEVDGPTFLFDCKNGSKLTLKVVWFY